MSGADVHELMVIRIVDDDEELLASSRFLLEGEGWFVRTYSSAEEFLENGQFQHSRLCYCRHPYERHERP